MFRTARPAFHFIPPNA